MQTTRHTLEKQLKLAWSIFQKNNRDMYDLSFNNPIPMNGEGPIRKIMGLTKIPISKEKEPLVRVRVLEGSTNQVVLYSMGNFDDQALHYMLYEALKTLARVYFGPGIILRSYAGCHGRFLAYMEKHL